jgi:hypothetical protein
MEDKNRDTFFNLVFIISKYSSAIMQVLDKEIPQMYVSRMNDTKCLNTCVMLIYILVGMNSLKLTKKCDVKYTIERNKYANHDITTLEKLHKCVFKKTKPDERRLIYVLLSDGYYKNKELRKYFPGHVFIIEVYGEEFAMYQSYINEYTLNESLRQFPEYKSIKRNHMKTHLNLLDKITKPNFIWKKQHVDAWCRLTQVKVDDLEGYSNVQSTVHICFKEIQIENTKLEKNAKHFVNRILRKIKYYMVNGPNDAYKPCMIQNEYEITQQSLNELNNEFKRFKMDINHLTKNKLNSK